MKWFTPNSSKDARLNLVWIAVGLAAWQFFRPTVFPGPVEIALALPKLWTDGAISDTITTLTINLEALCLSACIGLPIAYLARVPAVAPIAAFIGKLRFVGSAVFYLPLLLITSTLFSVKLWLLTLGELFYLVTTMVNVVQSIPEANFDDARTLKMSEWLSVWYVVIRGTVAQAIDAIRDNAAIGWGMVMFVEGVIRSEGGIGVAMFNAEKYANYDEFFAAVILIVLIGVGQDWIIGQIRKVACPYA